MLQDTDLEEHVITMRGNGTSERSDGLVTRHDGELLRIVIPGKGIIHVLAELTGHSSKTTLCVPPNA